MIFAYTHFSNSSLAYSDSFSTVSGAAREHTVKTIYCLLKRTPSTWRFTIWGHIP